MILKDGIALWEIQKNHIIPDQLGNESISNPKSNRFEIYFECPDLESVFGKLQKEGITFLHPIHEEPWGQRTFRFFDPDNHLVEIGEPLESFIIRLYNSGMTAEKVSEKTGVPVIQVQSIIDK